MDISDTLQPNSDQLDAIELAPGPRTFTISDVSRGNAEQPVNIFFHEFDRPWRPSKSMRRVLAACWGADASVYVGRRVQLYLDPNVTFGKEKVGGTRIAALSNIDKEKRIPLLVARGKSATFTVQPLPDAPAVRDWVAEARQFTTVDDIRAHWVEAKAGGATPQQLADIQALATTTQQEEQQ